MTMPLDVAVVGGGQAGLAIGYFLKQQGRRFTILGYGTIGQKAADGLRGLGANVTVYDHDSQKRLLATQNGFTCPGTPAAGCTPWEQWIYWNTPGTCANCTRSASIQYWLIGYGPTCPMGQGWIQYGNSCFKNSTNSVSLPNQPITNMAN